jgi:hypothetical protein
VRFHTRTGTRGNFHVNPLGDCPESVSRRSLLDLQQLSLDRAHSRHQTVEFRQKLPFILPGLFDQIFGGTVTDPVESVRQPPVEEPHMLLQIQEFLVKLGLLEHGRGSHFRTAVLA